MEKNPHVPPKKSHVPPHKTVFLTLFWAKWDPGVNLTKKFFGQKVPLDP